MNPAVAGHNSVFISLQNKIGEPISKAKVSITTLKQWLFSKQRNLEAHYVAAGTYRIDTDMGEGISEMNISIKPEQAATTRLRLEVDIPRPVALQQKFLLIQQ